MSQRHLLEAPAARYHLKRKNYFSIAVFANMTAQLCCVPPDRSAAQTAQLSFMSCAAQEPPCAATTHFPFPKCVKCYDGRIKQ